MQPSPAVNVALAWHWRVLCRLLGSQRCLTIWGCYCHTWSIVWWAHRKKHWLRGLAYQGNAENIRQFKTRKNMLKSFQKNIYIYMSFCVDFLWLYVFLILDCVFLKLYAKTIGNQTRADPIHHLVSLIGWAAFKLFCYAHEIGQPATSATANHRQQSTCVRSGLPGADSTTGGAFEEPRCLAVKTCTHGVWGSWDAFSA